MNTSVFIPVVWITKDSKGKGKRSGTCYNATYMSRTRAQNRFTILEVAADWHELMIPWCIIWPSIACANEQFDARCSTQIYHCPSQLLSVSVWRHDFRKIWQPVCGWILWFVVRQVMGWDYSGKRTAQDWRGRTSPAAGRPEPSAAVSQDCQQVRK